MQTRAELFNKIQDITLPQEFELDSIREEKESISPAERVFEQEKFLCAALAKTKITALQQHPTVNIRLLTQELEKYEEWLEENKKRLAELALPAYKARELRETKKELEELLDEYPKALCCELAHYTPPEKPILTRTGHLYNYDDLVRALNTNPRDRDPITRAALQISELSYENDPLRRNLNDQAIKIIADLKEKHAALKQTAKSEDSQTIKDAIKNYQDWATKTSEQLEKLKLEMRELEVKKRLREILNKQDVVSLFYSETKDQEDQLLDEKRAGFITSANGDFRERTFIRYNTPDETQADEVLCKVIQKYNQRRTDLEEKIKQAELKTESAIHQEILVHNRLSITERERIKTGIATLARTHYRLAEMGNDIFKDKVNDEAKSLISQLEAEREKLRDVKLTNIKRLGAAIAAYREKLEKTQKRINEIKLEIKISEGKARLQNQLINLSHNLKKLCLINDSQTIAVTIEDEKRVLCDSKAERGVVISTELLREICRKFNEEYARLKLEIDQLATPATRNISEKIVKIKRETEEALNEAIAQAKGIEPLIIRDNLKINWHKKAHLLYWQKQTWQGLGFYSAGNEIKLDGDTYRVPTRVYEMMRIAADPNSYADPNQSFSQKLDIARSQQPSWFSNPISGLQRQPDTSRLYDAANKIEQLKLGEEPAIGNQSLARATAITRRRI